MLRYAPHFYLKQNALNVRNIITNSASPALAATFSLGLEGERRRRRIGIGLIPTFHALNEDEGVDWLGMGLQHARTADTDIGNWNSS